MRPSEKEKNWFTPDFLLLLCYNISRKYIITGLYSVMLQYRCVCFSCVAGERFPSSPVSACLLSAHRVCWHLELSPVWLHLSVPGIQVTIACLTSPVSTWDTGADSEQQVHIVTGGLLAGPSRKQKYKDSNLVFVPDSLQVRGGHTAAGCTTRFTFYNHHSHQ